MLLFSETFISDFQEVRRTVIVNTENTTETLLISKSNWKTISNKKEFIYKGIYYDIKSIEYQKNVAKVKVVKDYLEPILSCFSKNLHSKSKKNKPINSKKSIVLFCSSIPLLKLYKNNVTQNQSYFYTNLYKNHASFSLFRPPLFV